jgi:hypothetical protein
MDQSDPILRPEGISAEAPLPPRRAIRAFVQRWRLSVQSAATRFSQVDNTNLYKSFVDYNWAVIWGLMGRQVSQIFLEIILITQISKLDRAISE